MAGGKKTVFCKRCGQKLTALLSKERKYGPTCWEKFGQFQDHSRIEHLENQIKKLQARLDALTARPMVPSLKAEVSWDIPNGETKESSEIPVLIGGWDVSELQENELFVKMKGLAEVA